MCPGLCHGDRVIARPCSADQLRPGDIVLARHPLDEQLLIKRLSKRCADGWWVLGDNPTASTDSRHFGVIPDALVMAVVTAIAPAASRLRPG